MSQVEPEVSVIVLAYNHVSTIDQCLESVLSQDFDGGIEVILGEDDSNDGTREKCQEWADRYPTIIRLILNHREDNIQVNGKPTGTGNWLLCHLQCRGRFVAYCEGDDYWIDAGKIRKQVEAMVADNDAVICYHRVKIEKDGVLSSDEDSVTEVRFRQIENPNVLDLDTLVRIGNFMHTPSVMIRRRAFEVHPFMRYSAIGDYLTYLGILARGGHILKLHGPPMAVYRTGIGTFTNQHYHLKLLDQLSCLSSALMLPLSLHQKHILFERCNELRSELNRYSQHILKREPSLRELLNIAWQKARRRFESDS